MKILLVGLGNLGSAIFDLLVRVPGRHVFLVGGRNEAYLHQRTNLARFTALQLGYVPEIACTALDLCNIEQTATVIAQFQPTIIVCAATLQRLGSTDHLPPAIAQPLAIAPLGPRLPLHLLLVYKLMQAVKQTGQTITVLNAIYSDVINPLLGKVGLAPTAGVGDLANNIPALRTSLALQLGQPREAVEVRLVMARYVSYWITRTSGSHFPFHLTVLVNGKDQTPLLDLKTVFDPLQTTWKRLGGTPGLLMTAASAAALFEAMTNNTDVITHAPGPHGLPGGYPVRVNAQGVEVVLPEHLSWQEALQINHAGLRLDGIEGIDHKGTVSFTEESMTIYKEILGYSCQHMPLSEVEEWANELQVKYQALEAKYR